MLKRPRYINGFTLIELMVTISIAAIVLGLAIPSFMETIRSNRITATTNEFLSALNFTRSEAVKRGLQVTMRRKSAAAGQWEAGWDIFVDSDNSNAFNDDGDTDLCETNADGSPAEDCLLKTHSALSSDITIRTGSTHYQHYAAFKAMGDSVGGQTDTFRVCSSQGDNTNSRAIVVNFIGRAKTSTGTSQCP